MISMRRPISIDACQKLLEPYMAPPVTTHIYYYCLFNLEPHMGITHERSFATRLH